MVNVIYYIFTSEVPSQTIHIYFSKLKNILFRIHLLLTPDREHRKVFENAPIIGFKKGKSLKDILVRAKALPKVLYQPRRVSMVLGIMQAVRFASILTKIRQFESTSTKLIYCNYSLYTVVYFFTCKIWYKH